MWVRFCPDTASTTGESTPSEQTESPPTMARTARSTAGPSSARKKRSTKTGTTRRTTGKASSSAVVQPHWKLVSKATKSYVLHLFDAGIRLLMHKVPEDIYEDVHSVLVDSRNQVAVKLETLKVPPTKQDYDHLSTTLAQLRDTKSRMEQRLAVTNTALDNQTRELENLEEEKVQLQDFGKVPSKHHPLLLEPKENELYLNFNTIK